MSISTIQALDVAIELATAKAETYKFAARMEEQEISDAPDIRRDAARYRALRDVIDALKQIRRGFQNG